MLISKILLLTLYLIWKNYNVVSGAIFSRLGTPEIITDVLPSRVVHNSMILYGLWGNPRRIPYRVASGQYSEDELNLIHTAMQQVSSDLSQCVQFQLFDPAVDVFQDHLFISKTLNDGSPSLTCFSFPGLVVRAQHGQGQKLLLTDGKHGCLNPMSLREVMKYLVISLGIRNEYNRPDRDRFLDVFPENIAQELTSLNLTTPYAIDKITILSSFDQDSITIPLPEKYVRSQTKLFSYKFGDPEARVARLSVGDCIGITTMYIGLGCNPNSCLQSRTSTPSIAPTTITSQTTSSSSTTTPIVITDTTVPTSEVCQLQSCQDWSNSIPAPSLSCDFGSSAQNNDEPAISNCENWTREMLWYRYRFNITEDESYANGAYAESKCTPRPNAGNTPLYDAPRAMLRTDATKRSRTCMVSNVSFSVYFEDFPEPPKTPTEENGYYLLVAWYVYVGENITNTTELPDLNPIWGHRSSDYEDVVPGDWLDVNTDAFIIAENESVVLVFIANHNDRCEKNVKAIRIDSINTKLAEPFPCPSTSVLEPINFVKETLTISKTGLLGESDSEDQRHDTLLLKPVLKKSFGRRLHPDTILTLGFAILFQFKFNL